MTNHTVIVKGFADLNAQEWHEAIGGAIFIVGCLVAFALFVWLMWPEKRP